MNLSLKASPPMGIICVLDVLNCVSATRHHYSRILVESVRESSSARKTVVSSVKRVAMSHPWVPGMVSPFRLDFLRARLSGSIPRLKRRQDRGSPWWTPLDTGKMELRHPLIITLVVAFKQRFCTVQIKWSGSLKALRVFQR